MWRCHDLLLFARGGGGTRMDGDGVGVDYAVKGLFTVWPLYIKHLD